MRPFGVIVAAACISVGLTACGSSGTPSVSGFQQSASSACRAYVRSLQPAVTATVTAEVGLVRREIRGLQHLAATLRELRVPSSEAVQVGRFTRSLSAMVPLQERLARFLEHVGPAGQKAAQAKRGFAVPPSVADPLVTAMARVQAIARVLKLPSCESAATY